MDRQESLGLGEQYVEGVVEIKSTIDASPLTPMDIMADNQATIAWSSNPVLSQCMRHVEREDCYTYDKWY